MSAVSNLTFVTINDANSPDPQLGMCMEEFANYNEAMSYAKWQSALLGNGIIISIWNYNGGSGTWYNGVFTSRPNSNWP